ncbi:MAG: bifunctional indole-3-glycerol-phosphate synthase TrpC/phosphoribosylanthranilate isomerase TrpF [Propionibacteriaceae bacterium]|jgi:indole-3-glycerol phosphate synthase/phosphoribosylanthranilate isomerase|nr:bifunctional indole-3-glycerol-phosphate synthase TrpC/phosphoribosylanthranilate isomerase TrpF [Propionibacteriaceae bacterium]
MPDILELLAAEAKERVAAAKAARPLAEVRAAAQDLDAATGFPFEAALSAGGLSFICEVKKASPSKGLIAPDFPYLDIARDYQAGGAAAISVLTEPAHFLGADEYLEQIAQAAAIPVLRKDFTVDEYQLFQAKELGADAVLLIVSILSPGQLADYLGIADSLGMSCLVEAHDAAEIATALAAGARIAGVNNRNLKDFSVDNSNAANLRSLVPAGTLFVSESGVSGPEDIAPIAAAGADAVLVGEALMRAADRVAALKELRAAAKQPPPALKVCGITRLEDVAWLNEVKPEYAGFIFVPSSTRAVSKSRARTIRSRLDPAIKTVGVFADAPISEVSDAVYQGLVSAVQLHGCETSEYIRTLRPELPKNVPIIKAVAVGSPQAIVRAARLGADYLLLDNLRGGSGQAFDWDYIAQARQIAAGEGVAIPPLWLAGGLHPGNVEAARKLGPYALDVNSGVETDGVKDPAKVRQFVAGWR